MNKLGIAAIAASILLAGCNVATPAKAPSAAVQEARSVEANQQNLIQRYPAPQLKDSLERKNLIERLQRINAQNMSGCIYLISYGNVMAFYPVKGKVTSLNAYLMAGERQVLKDIDTGEWNGTEYVAEEQPDYDGAYGKNADGIFFFTADTNSYVEWAGDYLWSDQCLALSQQPQIIREVK